MRYCFLSLFLSTLTAQIWIVPPDGGLPMLPTGSIAGYRLSAPSTLATMQQIAVVDMPFKEALRVEVKSGSAQAWDAQIIASTTLDVKAGDALLMTMFVRGSSSVNETGEVNAAAYVQRSSGDFYKVVSAALNAGSNWRQILVPVKAEVSIPAGQHQLVIHLAYYAQTIDIGGIELLNYRNTIQVEQLPRTKIEYAGQEADAPWRAEAAARIDQLRKADLQVKVVDRTGAAVSGADVRVRMTRHEFGFGSAVAADGINATGQDGNIYRWFIPHLFNKVVLENDLKWPQWEANRNKAMNALAWLREAGIDRVRGHNLVWPSWQYMPPDVQRLSGTPDALRARVLNHIAEEAGATKGQLVEWDVLNEPYTNTNLQQNLGDQEMAAWFQAAAKADPTPILYINDYSILSAGGLDRAHQDGYFSTIRKLIDWGAPLGGIGMQGHFGAQLTSVPRVWQILDRFATFGKPIQITEFDIDLGDEEVQGAYQRDFMTAVFAHPSISGFVMWGFWEGRHWKPRAAMLRKDWTLKPNGAAYVDLVFGEWWTDVRGRTGDEGNFAVRGFKGAYLVDVTSGGVTKTVPAAIPGDGSQLVVTLP